MSGWRPTTAKFWSAWTRSRPRWTGCALGTSTMSDRVERLRELRRRGTLRHCAGHGPRCGASPETARRSPSAVSPMPWECHAPGFAASRNCSPDRPNAPHGVEPEANRASESTGHHWVPTGTATRLPRGDHLRCREPNWAATSAPSAMPQSPSDHDLSGTCPSRGSPENTGISAGGSREADLCEPPYTAHTCRSRRIESLAFGGDRRDDPVCPRQALSPFDVSPLHA